MIRILILKFSLKNLVKFVNMSINGKEVSFTSSDASNEVRIKLFFAYSIVLSIVFKSYFIFRKSLLQKCPIRVTDLGLCLHVQQIHVVLVRILLLNIWFPFIDRN